MAEIIPYTEQYIYSLIASQLSLNPVEIHKQRDLCRVKRRNGKYGGYRKDILKEILTDRDEVFLICGICKGIMRQPCFTNSGEQFCSCCEEQSDLSEQTPNEVIRKMVDSLKCSCPLLERGCEWLGTLKDCEEHLETCGYVRVECKLGCGVVSHRKKIRMHEEVYCLCRIVECEHCIQYFFFYIKTIHLEVCPKKKVSCELKCGVVMCREDMAQHLEQECGMVLETCKLVGCGVKTTRNERKIHLTDTCVLRLMQCEHCQRDIKFCDMSPHLDVCPKMKVSCELACGVVLCRPKMAQHLKEECGMMLETCKLIGCGMKITRNELKIHLTHACVQRLIQCEYCQEDIKFCDTTTHLEVCPKKKVSCELCDKMMCREDMAQHLEQECGMVIEMCKLRCGVKMTRNKLKIHLTDTCVQRLIQCEHCREDIKFCDMPNHLDVCPKMRVLCELCDNIMCREDMAQHLEVECVEKVIMCPFAKYDCEVTSIKRKHLSQHLEEKRIKHLELKLNAVEEGVRTYREESKQHRAQIKQYMDEVNQQRKHMDKQTIRIDRMSEHINTLCSISKITMLDWNIENLSKFIQINHIPEQRNVAGCDLSIHFLKEHIYVSYADTQWYRSTLSAKYLICLYSTIKCKVVKQYDCGRVDVYGTVRYLGGYEKSQIARILKSDAKELSRTGSANKLILEMYITKL